MYSPYYRQARPPDQPGQQRRFNKIQFSGHTGLSFSVVDHLRWDLSAIFEMAVAERVILFKPGDPPLHTEVCAPG